ncbi:MAG: peptidoglycan DD-metalloendopeptidase family protein [Flavobacteriales bacterium]|jgi:septal ring factor EnvC (AmiA/AmiB activator)|nr:peptidoglycan DD-metalloendopeptidase family protein [Flavobacteriales bacterium]
MYQLIKYILILLFFLSSDLLFSQNKTKLEKEKQELEIKIKQTHSQLNKEKKKKNSALEQLQLSNKKIKQHNQLLNNLENTIKVQNSSIKKVEKQTLEIEENILIKEEELTLTQNTLSNIIYQTYVWKNTYNESFFLISSDDLNQLYKRKQYLNQLALNRKNQISKIKKIRKELEGVKQKLINEETELLKEEKRLEDIFSNKESENKILELEKNNNSKIVFEIKKNEQHYRNKLNEQKKEAKEIEEQIKKIIEEEIRKSREEAEKNNSGSPLTPEDLELSSNFTSNKGRLPWPLEKGIIVSSFGIQKNKAISGVETKNNGIDFSTDPGQNCRVIFDGKISRIFFIKGKGKAVLVNHGNYFTVYSGLENIVVKSGDKVISKQKIGTIITSETTKETQLHFEIWKGKETQNPVKWLYKAN